MKSNIVVIENPLIINDRTIIPLTRIIRYRLSKPNKGLTIQLKVPVAVIIRTSSREQQVYKINGEVVTVEQLAEDLPEVKELLDNLYIN
jgi:hypothetical protein